MIIGQANKRLENRKKTTNSRECDESGYYGTMFSASKKKKSLEKSALDSLNAKNDDYYNFEFKDIMSQGNVKPRRNQLKVNKSIRNMNRKSSFFKQDMINRRITEDFDEDINSELKSESLFLGDYKRKTNVYKFFSKYDFNSFNVKMGFLQHQIKTCNDSGDLEKLYTDYTQNLGDKKKGKPSGISENGYVVNDKIDIKKIIQRNLRDSGHKRNKDMMSGSFIAKNKIFDVEKCVMNTLNFIRQRREKMINDDSGRSFIDSSGDENIYIKAEARNSVQLPQTFTCDDQKDKKVNKVKQKTSCLDKKGLERSNFNRIRVSKNDKPRKKPGKKGEKQASGVELKELNYDETIVVESSNNDVDICVNLPENSNNMRKTDKVDTNYTFTEAYKNTQTFGNGSIPEMELNKQTNSGEGTKQTISGLGTKQTISGENNSEQKSFTKLKRQELDKLNNMKNLFLNNYNPAFDNCFNKLRDPNMNEMNQLYRQKVSKQDYSQKNSSLATFNNVDKPSYYTKTFDSFPVKPEQVESGYISTRDMLNLREPITPKHGMFVKHDYINQTSIKYKKNKQANSSLLSNKDNKFEYDEKDISPETNSESPKNDNQPQAKIHTNENILLKDKNIKVNTVHRRRLQAKQLGIQPVINEENVYQHLSQKLLDDQLNHDKIENNSESPGFNKQLSILSVPNCNNDPNDNRKDRGQSNITRFSKKNLTNVSDWSCSTPKSPLKYHSTGLVNKNTYVEHDTIQNKSEVKEVDSAEEDEKEEYMFGELIDTHEKTNSTNTNKNLLQGMDNKKQDLQNIMTVIELDEKNSQNEKLGFDSLD